MIFAFTPDDFRQTGKVELHRRLDAELLALAEHGAAHALYSDDHVLPRFTNISARLAVLFLFKYLLVDQGHVSPLAHKPINHSLSRREFTEYLRELIDRLNKAGSNATHGDLLYRSMVIQHLITYIMEK